MFSYLYSKFDAMYFKSFLITLITLFCSLPYFAQEQETTEIEEEWHDEEELYDDDDELPKAFFALEMSEYAILYRGYRNTIYVSTPCNEGDSIELVPLENCSIIKGDNEGEFIVSPGSYRSSKLMVIKRIDDEQIDTLRIAEFRVRSAPLPGLKWGSHSSGSVVEILHTRLFSGYGDEIPITACFNITSHEIIIGKKKYTGKGSILKEPIIKQLQKIKKPTTVKIIATVMGPFGDEPVVIFSEYLLVPPKGGLKIYKEKYSDGC